MNLETFFEKFDLFADAPNAVAKMRELVLRLAFSGGLSGKTPNDDGALSGWERRTIESICSLITPGFACSRNHQIEGGHVHLRTHNISTLGALNFDLLVRIDPKRVDPQKSSIRRGDVLFNNTNSQELVGKTSLVDRDYDYAFSNHITRLRLKEGIFPGFVVFYLTLLRNSGYFANICTRWINQAAVNTDTLKEQFIPLPPLAEQKRIVAKVDELMALCDRLEAQQKERETRHAALARASLARFADAPTPANLNFIFHKSYDIAPADLRKTILTLAVQGKLVPHEVACAKWETRKLRDLTTKIGSGSTPLGGKESYHAEGIPLIRSMNVHFGGFVRSGLVFLNDEQAEKLKTVTVKTNDVLLNITGASIGRVATAPQDMEGARVNQHVCIVRPTQELLPKFLEICLASPIVQNLIEDIQVGATREALTKGMIEQFVIPVPSLVEQRRIVAKVDELMALVDVLESQLGTARTAAEKLMEAVVAELTACGRPTPRPPRSSSESAATRNTERFEPREIENPHS